MSRSGEDERPERVVGLAAAYAVMRVRPDDVWTIVHAASARRELRELLREAARLRIAYREVEGEELERIADTLHHEGVCLLVRPRPRVQVAELARAIAREGILLALDHVENPHNVGALLRSAAYFGARGLVLARPRERALTPAAVRVAEGGAEHVPTCVVPNLAAALTALQDEGATVVGADAHRGVPATRFRFPPRAVLVLGSERHGLAPEVERCCDALVHIPGTGALESLNVSVAAGILLALAASRPQVERSANRDLSREQTRAHPDHARAGRQAETRPARVASRAGTDPTRAATRESDSAHAAPRAEADRTRAGRRRGARPS